MLFFFKIMFSFGPCADSVGGGCRLEGHDPPGLASLFHVMHKYYITQRFGLLTYVYFVCFFVSLVLHANILLITPLKTS